MTPQYPVQHIPNAAVDQLLASVQGNPIAMANCARTLLVGSDNIHRARFVCQEALALAPLGHPLHPELRALTRPILSDGVGSWYFTMVLDEPRHRLYAKALRRLLVNGGVVLDIGSGTGLFAMLAIQAGADHVIACERDPAVAQASQEIFDRNGFSDRITLLPIDSRHLEIGKHMPAAADVLLWDNLANNFLGAGCAATLADAKARLLKPNAPILPERCEIIAAIATDLEAEERAMGIVESFDFSPFNILQGTDFTLSSKHFKLRSAPFTMFDIDVTKPESIKSERHNVTASLNDGRINGIAQWLRFHLGNGLTYETSDKDVCAFAPQFHVVDPFDAHDGMQVQLHGAHDTIETWFWVEQ